LIAEHVVNNSIKEGDHIAVNTNQAKDALVLEINQEEVKAS
jgi:hypothetical protein